MCKEWLCIDWQYKLQASEGVAWTRARSTAVATEVSLNAAVAPKLRPQLPFRNSSVKNRQILLRWDGYPELQYKVWQPDTHITYIT